MSVSRAYRLFRILLLGSAVAFAGCSTTGNSFVTSDLRFLEPGFTTYDETVALLQADPVNVYRQLDGSATARWAHTSTVLTDAIYFNQELWLAFDAYGYFQRIVKSHNVPHADQYQDGRRVDTPLPVEPVAYAPPPPPAAAPAVSSPPVTTHAPQAVEQPLSRTAVSYPLSR